MPTYAHTLKKQALSALLDPSFDFIATYHAVADLRRLAQKHPGVMDERTVETAARLLVSNDHENARQSYFLFREVAKILTDLAVSPETDGLGATALASLVELLRQTDGSAHRGIAEALGSLPVRITGPRLTIGPISSHPTISWERLIKANGLVSADNPRYVGRSLVASIPQSNRVLVIKLAKQSEPISALANEIRWMEMLKKPDFTVDCRFDIPTPIRIQNRMVFCITRLPIRPPMESALHPERLAIGFLAHRDYFVYPNDPLMKTPFAKEILRRSAFLLGRLAARGIIHDAPIPLFHNRTQRLRREDQGRYQWFRAGRLDQWLESCDFPNFGLSGLRDFEHLATICDHGRNLYRHVCTHFFSLLLVAGSHFRCRDRSRAGIDEKGNPVDARGLFDRDTLKKMIREIFTGYYEGFVETTTVPRPPVDLNRLADRMIEEMGVDRYMTELLRRTDQNALTDEEFSAFLKTRGYDERQIKGLHRGERDILITSGPHLGDFNRQISLPEMIQGTAAMAAVCIAGRFAVATKGLHNEFYSVGK